MDLEPKVGFTVGATGLARQCVKFRPLVRYHERDRPYDQQDRAGSAGPGPDAVGR